jgi:hypothetical protein
MSISRVQATAPILRPNEKPVSGYKPVCIMVLLCAATAIASQAQTFTTLVSFTSPIAGGTGARTHSGHRRELLWGKTRRS